MEGRLARRVIAGVASLAAVITACSDEAPFQTASSAPNALVLTEKPKPTPQSAKASEFFRARAQAELASPLEREFWIDMDKPEWKLRDPHEETGDKKYHYIVIDAPDTAPYSDARLILTQGEYIEWTYTHWNIQDGNNEDGYPIPVHMKLKVRNVLHYGSIKLRYEDFQTP